MDNNIEARVMIHDRYAKYCFALDSSNADAFTECFTVDGMFNVVGRAEFAGHEAMRGLISKTSEGRPRHHFLNFHVKEVNDDTAQSTAYFLLLDPSNGETNAYGHYEDTLVREDDGQWRFSDRQVHFQWTSDSYGARKVEEAKG